MEITFTPVTIFQSAVSEAGAGGSHLLSYPARSFGVEVSWAVTGEEANKEVTAITVDLEGSISGTTFEQIGQKAASAGELTAKYFLFAVVDKPCCYVRANITALTITGDAGTVTLTIKVIPMK
jgi:hypothetical protein